MSKHLSEIEVDGYVHGKLPPEEILRIDDHITDCDECRAAAATRSQADTSVLLAAFEGPDVDPHLAFDELAAYVDHEIDAVGAEIVTLHLSECSQCRVHVRDLELLRNDIQRKDAGRPVLSTAAFGFWDRMRQFRLPAYAFAVASVILIGMVFALWYLRDRPDEPETAAVAQPAGAPTAAAPTAAPDNVAAVSDDGNIADKPKPVVSLNDGASRIDLDASGKVSGLNDPHSEQVVADILRGRDLAIDPDVRQLRQSSGQLMGGGQTGVPFALKGPVGTVVDSAQPTLRWKQLDGADTYRVEIFDDSFNKVASSPPLKMPEWKPGSPLARGGTYRWQVTAVVNGEEIRSPVRPAPDAKFKVLDAASSQRITEARARRSHLLLGVLYARSGLLADAEREFEALVRSNPGSPVARRLLEQVRSAR